MKQLMQGFLRKAGLCLCLFGELGLSSCAVQRSLNLNDQGPFYYLVQVRILPGYANEMVHLCLPGSSFLQVTGGVPDFFLNTHHSVAMAYRYHSYEQAMQAQEQLLAFGLVEEIHITRIDRN